MATFLTNLLQSIFTPGPTPTLVRATNAAFAALQAIFLALLITTSSIHFLILSILCAGLWFAINWFVTEIQAADEKEEQAKKLRDLKKAQDSRSADDSGTETEDGEQNLENKEYLLKPASKEDPVKKGRSVGEASGEMSTDSEWDKMENEGDEDN